MPVIPDRFTGNSPEARANPPRISALSYLTKKEYVNAILTRASMDSQIRTKALTLIDILFNPDTQNQFLPPYFDNLI